MRDGPERQLDLNLLVALDALLEEGSVTGAAARLHVSAPAMSRTLGRIRTVLRDPVLVRAGRELVPTPRAVELRPRVRALVHQAHALLVPEPVTDPARLTREFTVQAGEMLLPGLAPRLVRAVVDQAPGVTLRFMPEAWKVHPPCAVSSISKSASSATPIRRPGSNPWAGPASWPPCAPDTPWHAARRSPPGPSPPPITSGCPARAGSAAPWTTGWANSG